MPTVTPGCALNAATGRAQRYVHLFDNGGFLLNVSVNGQPLTQLSSLKTHAPVFLAAGLFLAEGPGRRPPRPPTT